MTGVAKRTFDTHALEQSSTPTSPTTGGRRPTQWRPPSVVRTNDVHGRFGHGAVPSAQPASSLTKVKSCTVNPAGTGPPAGPTAPDGLVGEEVGVVALLCGPVGLTLGA